MTDRAVLISPTKRGGADQTSGGCRWTPAAPENPRVCNSEDGPSRSKLKVSLTRRALEKQLMRAGTPKKEAVAVAARLPHRKQWRKLPEHVRAEIAWKVATTHGSKK